MFEKASTTCLRSTTGWPRRSRPGGPRLGTRILLPGDPKLFARRSAGRDMPEGACRRRVRARSRSDHFTHRSYGAAFGPFAGKMFQGHRTPRRHQQSLISRRARAAPELALALSGVLGTRRCGRAGAGDGLSHLRHSGGVRWRQSKECKLAKSACRILDRRGT